MTSPRGKDPHGPTQEQAAGLSDRRHERRGAFCLRVLIVEDSARGGRSDQRGAHPTRWPQGALICDPLPRHCPDSGSAGRLGETHRFSQQHLRTDPDPKALCCHALLRADTAGMPLRFGGRQKPPQQFVAKIFRHSRRAGQYPMSVPTDPVPGPAGGADVGRSRRVADRARGRAPCLC